MPGPASHTYHSDKMKSCLEQLEAKGADPGKAHAICYAQLGAEANKLEKSAGDKPCEYCSPDSARFIVKDAKHRYTLGVVYEPDTLDTDGEYATAEDIEKAAHDFMRYLQGRRGLSKVGLDILAKIKEASDSGDEVKLEIDGLDEIAKQGVNSMHLEDLEDSEVVESFVAPIDMKIGDETVKKGSWLAGIVWDDKHFQKIQSGEWTGYSMGGFARKVKSDGN